MNFLVMMHVISFLLCLKALLELWHAGVLKKFDEEKLLVKAESAKLYIYKSRVLILHILYL